MARGRCIRSSRPKKSKGVGSYSLTLPFFLVILSRFRKNVPARVSYGGSVRGTQPEHCGRVKPKGRVKLSRPIFLDWLLSCEGQGSSHRCPRVSPPWRAMRAGIGETESAPSYTDARPPSRFSSGSGTKADAKQQRGAFALLCGSNAA